MSLGDLDHSRLCFAELFVFTLQRERDGDVNKGEAEGVVTFTNDDTNAEEEDEQKTRRSKKRIFSSRRSL